MYDEMMKRQQKAKEAEEAKREKVCFFIFYCHSLERKGRDHSRTPWASKELGWMREILLIW